MQRRVSQEIELLLTAAAEDGSCLVAPCRRLRDALERRVATGEVVSPAPHLYAAREIWDGLSRTERTRYLVTGFSRLHPDWTFCGTSAAVMHGLSVSEGLQRPLEIAAPSRVTAYPRNVVVRRYGSDAPTITVEGVRVTTPERTVLDCARWLPFREGLAVADSSLRLDLVDGGRLNEYVRSAGRGLRGVARARLVARLADPRPENGMESIARATMYELGFSLPELQVPLLDPMDSRRVLRVDFMWVLPDGTVIIGELDGGEKYWNPAMNGGTPLVAMRGERRRESRLTIDRPKIVRFSPDEVEDIAYFNRLLETFGVPREREPIIEIPDEVPFSEVAPVEAYGLP